MKRRLGLFALSALLTLSLGVSECDVDEIDLWFADQFNFELTVRPFLEARDAEVPAAGQTIQAAEKEEETKDIEIRGSKEFETRTLEAFDILRAQAPDAYQQVLASIDIIESVPKGSGMYVDEGRFAVGEGTAYAPGYDRHFQVIWYASAIVHDACHSALHARGEVWHGKQGEVACMKAQLAVLKQLKDGDVFVDHVQGIIDGVDDPANQYWTYPEQHW